MHETKGSGGSGLVTGEFLCDCIMSTYFYESFVAHSGLSIAQLEAYGQGKPLTALHIKSVRKYKNPLPLSLLGVTSVPQSWQYVIKLACEKEIDSQ